ncbi:hypothetical protein [Capybara microvirus Cap3_SP_475]|nr:hypothetical protein [Capybara microvirus Cap3_SP_475]
MLSTLCDFNKFDISKTVRIKFSNIIITVFESSNFDFDITQEDKNLNDISILNDSILEELNKSFTNVKL